MAKGESTAKGADASLGFMDQDMMMAMMLIVMLVVLQSTVGRSQ